MQSVIRQHMTQFFLNQKYKLQIGDYGFTGGKLPMDHDLQYFG